MNEHSRCDIINYFIESRKYTKYLEIGILTGEVVPDYNRCIEVLKQDGRNFINSYFQSIDNIQFEEDEKLRIIDVAVKTIYADNKIEYAEVKFFKSLCQHLSVAKDIIVKNNPDVDEYWLEEDILSQEDNDKFIDLIDFSNINYEKSNS